MLIEEIKGLTQKTGNQIVATNNEINILTLDITAVDKLTADILDRWTLTTLRATGSPFQDFNGLNSDGNPFQTATGTGFDWGTIAVNTKILPYGTYMVIENYGAGIARDTGEIPSSKIDLIDLYFPTFKEAITWGNREVKVVIISPK